MSLDPNLFPAVAAGVAVVALGIGFVVGRRTGAANTRIMELEAEVEVSKKERELAQASVAAAKQEIVRIRTELDDYRNGVVEHFTDTSTLLRDLTHQYRTVYEHLTAGATTLCPEGSISLLEGMRNERLPEVGEKAGSEASDDSPPSPPSDASV